jgi:hypothetical protein
MASPDGDRIAIAVKSSDPTRVTGGDALVEIMVPGSGARPKVTANGTDVSGAFKATGQAGHYLGVVGGLKIGRNSIVASRAGQSAMVEITDYPVTGPVFAGPKEQPFICETAGFKLADGSMLPAPKDADCSVSPVVTYVYKPLDGKGFKPLPSLKQLPADVAKTTTTLGKTVPYVVRVEAGTIDRGIYQIAVLHDPTSGLAITPVTGSTAWNKRMVYVFGGGCGGMYRQGKTTGDVLDDQFLGQGYATMSNSLNVFANNCDDLLATEAAMMTREQAIKTLGVPIFTLGFGCSGGAHQVLLIADNYPGLLDGIIPLCNSVDWSRMGQQSADVTLLYDWFKKPAASALTDEQKFAISGMPLVTNALPVARSIATACPDVVPAAQVYDAKTNPKGVRCTIGDHSVNSIGRDPATGFGLNIVDNVGVQYGLGALNAGKITAAQFLDLNEQIGGFDNDGAPTATRAVADLAGVEAAYRTGRVLNAGLGLKDIPVLDMRNYSDLDKDAGHPKYGTYVTLARLERETGSRANYVVFLESHRNGPYSANRPGGDEMSRYGIKMMDAWLTAIALDKAPGTQREKTLRDKPADLVDACYDRDGQRIAEEQTVSGGRCNEIYPTHLPPRMVAGGPLTSDVIKCQLKPVDANDYQVKFTSAEFTRLKTIFPDGVCDWSKKGVAQVPPSGVWQSF